MGPVFWLSMRQLTGKWRLSLIIFLAALPVILAIIVSLSVEDDRSFDENFIDRLLDGMLVMAIMPIVTLALSTAAFGSEMEDKTLSFLMLKPIPRWRIALPKLMASVVIGAPLIVVSGVVAAVVGLEVGAKGAFAVGVALFAGYMTYAAIFTWVGLITNRALAFAVIYVFLWEDVISSFIDGVAFLSVRGYTLAIMHGFDESTFRSLESRVIELPAGIIGAIAVTTVFLVLGIRRLRSMDVP